jgi:hypothetical protein
VAARGLSAQLDAHNIRVLGRIADEVDRFRDGRQSMLELLNRSWGLFTAADVRDDAAVREFMSAYYALSAADDANQPSTAGPGSDQPVESALLAFQTWANRMRELAISSGANAG